MFLSKLLKNAFVLPHFGLLLLFLILAEAGRPPGQRFSFFSTECFSNVFTEVVCLMALLGLQTMGGAHGPARIEAPADILAPGRRHPDYRNPRIEAPGVATPGVVGSDRNLMKSWVGSKLPEWLVIGR